MFNLNDAMDYYLYPYPTDMRKSFYTLSALVHEAMGKDVQSGDVFLFINRKCTSLKILHMECGGLVIYHMRLEQGTFLLPQIVDKTSAIYTTNWQELMHMVQGIDSSKLKQRPRWSSSQKALKNR